MNLPPWEGLNKVLEVFEQSRKTRWLIIIVMCLLCAPSIIEAIARLIMVLQR